jgi:hypothetical protein
MRNFAFFALNACLSDMVISWRCSTNIALPKAMTHDGYVDSGRDVGARALQKNDLAE